MTPTAPGGSSCSARSRRRLRPGRLVVLRGRLGPLAARAHRQRLLRRPSRRAAPRRGGDRHRPGRQHRHHRRRRRPRLRRAGAGHRLLPVRPAGARQGLGRLLRLPHISTTWTRSAPTPRRHGLRPRGRSAWWSAAGCSAWRPPARCGCSACRRTWSNSRPAADAAAGRRGRRRALLRSDDRGAGHRRHSRRGHLCDRARSARARNRLRVTLANGTELIDAALLVFSAGVRPRTSWPAGGRPRRRRARRRRCRRAVPTSDPHIYAIGECACDRRPRATAWSRPATRWPRCVADRLLGGDARVHRRRPVHEAQAARRRRRQLRRRAGQHAAARSRSCVSATRSRGTYAKLVVSDDAQDPARRRPGRRRSQLRRCCGRWSARRCPATRSTLIAPAGSGDGARDRRGRAARRRADLLLPQRDQGRDLRRDRRPGLHDVADLKGCTPRQAPAAGRACRCCKQLLAAERRRQSRTALCEHFAPVPRRAVRDRRRPAAITHLHRADRAARHAARAATSASRRWPRSWPRTRSRAHPRRRAGGAAGHQRPLPGQHPAQRHLLGRAADPRRRDHAGAS